MSFNFGATTAAAPAASSGFSFGASTPAPAAGGGFSFGGGGAAAPAAASGGFSFGGGTTTATPAPAASGGFSFGGGATTATPAPAASGGFSFGGTTSAAPAAAPASSGGFSFGAAAPATSTAGGSLFGGATTTTTPSLFGGAASGGSSMFGAKPAGTTSLFGGAAPSTGTSSFGGFGTGFGTTPQQPQPVAPAQPSITLETKFDALPADVKKNMTDFHKFLKDEDQSDAFLKSVSARKLDALKGNLDQLEQDVLVRRNLQNRQATAVHHVRKDVKHLINQVDTATLNLRSMSGESTSQKFYGIMRRVEMPSPYYWELLDNFEARMEQLKSQIEGVESEFKPLYDKQRRGGGGGGGYDTTSFSGMDPALLQQILISQNNALIQVAAHVAEVHEKTEEMRQAFIQKMKEDMLKHGDKNLAGFKNPFDKKKKNSASRESDIDNIRFKTSVAPTIVATQQPPQPQAAPATGFGGFGTTTPATGALGFGTTSSFGQPAASSGGSLFGGGASATAAPAVSTGGGFSFGGAAATTTAPKQVSFSLGGSTAPTVSTGAASTGFGFGAPATPAPGASATAAPGGFGAAGSSFLPATTPAFAAGDKRTAGAASKSGGLRSRQKKR